MLFDGEDQRIREYLISREPPTSEDTGKELKVWNAVIGGEDYLMVNGVSAQSGFRIQYALEPREGFSGRIAHQPDQHGGRGGQPPPDAGI